MGARGQVLSLILVAAHPQSGSCFVPKTGCVLVMIPQDTEYGASGSGSWIGSIVDTIVGNLKISFSNVHIRYEDPGGYCTWNTYLPF